MQHIRTLIAKDFDAVNNLIIEQLNSDVDLVENIGQHLIQAGGKRIRPLIALLCAKALGPEETRPEAIKFAAVIEFIHTATLLHDDVVDVSSLRRGLPTANAKWGNAPSVLVGDFVYSRAFQLMVSMQNMSIMQLMANTTNEIAEGEVLQLTKAGDANTSEVEYFEVIRRKTAVLFAAACQGPALLQNASPQQTEALKLYGLNVGTIFQLIDDLLDYHGDPAKTGKNIGDDLNEGKPTLPLIYTIQHGSKQDKSLISKAISNKDAAHLEEISAAVSRSGALPYIKKQAERLFNEAHKALSTLPDSNYKEALAEVARLALHRDS